MLHVFLTGVRFSAGIGIFFRHRVQGSGSQPASCHLGKGEKALSYWVKWSWHESDHLPPSCAKVKNVWTYTSALLYWFLNRQWIYWPAWS